MAKGYRVIAAAALALVVSIAIEQPTTTAATGDEPLTAAGLVSALAREGVAVPTPIDTTTQECPAAGCQQAIVTDTMRVKSFAGFSEAAWYAATRGLPRFGNIVVEFAPPLTPEQRESYLEAIGRLLP